MSTGRIYSVAFDGVAATVAIDFFELSPASQAPIIVHGFILSQSSDVGDAAEEILRIGVIRGNSTSGSGGSTTTAQKRNAGDASANTGAETCNTTQASTGTPIALMYDTFNVRTGYQFWWPPELRPTCTNGALFCVRLMAAPADSLTFSGTIWFEEPN